MTRAELIRKIAKFNGVPDYEAKYFFETFLQKALGVLQPNQAVKVNDFGYFQQRQAVVKTSNLIDKKVQPSDVILFLPKVEGAGSLVFNIPANPDEKYNLIDSYFSLSIGKPVIPLAGVKNNEIYLQPTGAELKKLIESKAEKLLNECEIVIQKIQEDDFLVINKTSDDQFDIELSSGKADFIKANQEETGKVSKFEHVAWDFGEDLSKQIEEESILDISSETTMLSPTENNEEPEEVGWDFGQSEWEADLEVPFEQFPEEKEEFHPNINIDEEFGHEVENEIKEENKEVESNTDNNDFERVKSITSEFEPEKSNFGLTKSELNLSWDFDNLNDTEELNDEKTIIESNTDEINLEQDWNADRNDNISSDKQEEVFDKGKMTNSESEISASTNEIKLNKFFYTKSRSPFVFFIAMVTILTVSAVVVVYLTGNSFTKLSKQFFGTKAQLTKQIKPEIIDRNFEVPVTYPYSKNNSAKITGNDIDPKVFKTNNPSANNRSSNQISNLSSLLNSKTNQTASATSKPPINPTPSRKVKPNIYLSGGNYIVQISSWKSRSIAESEALKYSKKGYNSFVETAEVPGRGTWYRVKVGDFKKLSDAEGFLNKSMTK